MDVTVNGERHDVEPGQTLAGLLARLGVDPERGIAVLLNGEVARRSQWPQHTLQADDQVEIVRATVGG